MLSTPGRGAWYVGHLAGIPLYIHWSALFLVYMVYVWTPQHTGIASTAEWFILQLIVLVLGVLLHEMGHGLTARLLGAFGVTITLEAFGGVCRSYRDLLPRREIPILVAGPLVSIVLAVIGWGAFTWLAHHPPAWFEGSPDIARLSLLFLFLLWQINQTLAVFNLMPIYPLDGGQIVFNLALGITGRQLLARKLALTLAVLGAMAYFAWRTGMFEGRTPGEGSMYLAVLLGLLVFQAYVHLR